MEHNSAYCGYELSKGEIKTVLQAFEQLKQYRAIGTVEEIKSFFNENRKAGYSHGYSDGYNKAIDEFAELLKGNLIRKYANATLTQQYVALQVTDWCNEIAEQMKAGAE